MCYVTSQADTKCGCQRENQSHSSHQTSCAIVTSVEIRVFSFETPTSALFQDKFSNKTAVDRSTVILCLWH